MWFVGYLSHVNKRVWAVVALVVGVVVGVVGFALGSQMQESSASADEEVTANWLFTQTADGGSISPNGDDTWTLTLTNIDPVVLAFTDRPLRDAQAGTVEKLVDAWPTMFSDSNPNGVVVAHNQSGATNSAVVEMMDPKLDGSTLTYTVRVLTNEGGPAEAGMSYDFEQVSVFIDDVTTESWACLTITNPAVVLDPPGILEEPAKPPAKAKFSKDCDAVGGVMQPYAAIITF
jgi:hypothetical protein